MNIPAHPGINKKTPIINLEYANEDSRCYENETKNRKKKKN